MLARPGTPSLGSRTALRRQLPPPLPSPDKWWHPLLTWPSHPRVSITTPTQGGRESRGQDAIRPTRILASPSEAATGFRGGQPGACPAVRPWARHLPSPGLGCAHSTGPSLSIFHQGLGESQAAPLPQYPHPSWCPRGLREGTWGHLAIARPSPITEATCKNGTWRHRRSPCPTAELGPRPLPTITPPSVRCGSVPALGEPLEGQSGPSLPSRRECRQSPNLPRGPRAASKPCPLLQGASPGRVKPARWTLRPGLDPQSPR